VRAIIYPVRKQTAFTLLKIVIGTGLIVLLIRIIPLREVATHLRNANIYYLLLATGLLLSGLLVGPVRWSGLLSTKGIHIPLRKLASYFYIGLFFNNFLPTIVGGDVARATYVALESDKRSEAFASTVVDRAIGFLALTVIVLFVTLTFSHLVLDKSIFVVLVLVIFCITVLVSLFFNRSIFNRLVGVLPRIRFYKLGSRLASLYSSIYSYREHKSPCLIAFGLSIVLQSALIMSNCFLGYSVGVRISPVYYFLFIPLISFMSMIPLSPNAIGIRESGYVLLFSQIGVTRSQALSLSFLNLFLVLLAALIGGICFLFQKERFKL